MILDAGIPNVLRLSAGLDPCDGSGHYDLALAGMRMVGGRIAFHGEYFDLSGEINLIVIKLGLSGSLGPRGIRLGGSVQYGIQFPWPIGFIGFAIHLQLDNGFPTIDLQLPTRLSGSGCLRRFGGTFAIMVRIAVTIWPNPHAWVVLPFGQAPQVHIANTPLGVGCPGLLASAPEHRMESAADQHLRALALTPALAQPLAETAVVLAAAARMLTVVAADRGPEISSEDEAQRAMVLFLTLGRYRTVFGQAEGLRTGGRWVRLSRTDAAEDLLTELAVRVAEQRPKADIDAAGATVTLEHDPHRGSARDLLATVTLTIDGRSESVTMPLRADLRHEGLHAAAERLEQAP
jgi:hypothetical protein